MVRLWASPSLALSRAVRIERQMDMGCGEETVDGRWYQLTQGLPLASGNTAGTNGPSSELAEGIVSESSSTGDYHCLSLCLSYKQLMLSQPTKQAHRVCVSPSQDSFGADARLLAFKTLIFCVRLFIFFMSMHAWRIKTKQCSLRGKIRIIAGAVLEKKEEIETVGKRQEQKQAAGSHRLSAVDTVSSRTFKEKLWNSPSSQALWPQQEKTPDVLHLLADSLMSLARKLSQLVVLPGCLGSFAYAAILQREMSRSVVVIFHVPDLPTSATLEDFISVS